MINQGLLDDQIRKTLSLLKANPDDLNENLLINWIKTNEESDYVSNAVSSIIHNNPNDTVNRYLYYWIALVNYYFNDFQSFINCLKIVFPDENEYLHTTRLLGLSDDFIFWSTICTENFTFHYPTNLKNLINITSFINRREYAYNKNSKYFSSITCKKIDYFIWDDPQKALDILKRPLGFALAQFSVIHSMYNQTAGHEITHVLLNSMDGLQTQSGFINEGIAVLFDHSNRDLLSNAKAAIKSYSNYKLDIKSIWSNFYDYPSQFSYPISALFIQTMIKEGGKDLFIKLCKQQDYDNAKIIYGDKLANIIENTEGLLTC